MADNRIERVDPATASPAQLAVMEEVKAARGRIPTPFNIWLHNPGLASGMNTIGTHVDASPVLTEAESEVAILATAVFWNAPYVIANHRRHALKSGLTEDVVEAILEKRRPAGGEGRIGAVCDAVFDLLEGGQMDEERFARYDRELGRATIAELLVTIGYFTSISLAMTCHAMTPKY